MLLDRKRSDVLAKLPWTPLFAPTAQSFQIKKLFGPDYYLILVTDLRNVWLEHAESADIYTRAHESEIAVIQGDSERLIALIKILSTFLDHVQEVQESANKLDIICSRNVGFACVPWLFRCEKMTSSGSTSNALSGPDTLYKHLIGPTLTLGGTYETMYLQQRQQVLALNQELDHLYEVMTKAGLGTPSSRRHVTSESDELKRLNEIIEEQAAKGMDMPPLISTCAPRLLAKATESILMTSSLRATSNVESTDTTSSPIQDELIIAAGLHNNLPGKDEQLSDSRDPTHTKTSKEKEHEKRTALREAMAQENDQRKTKKKRLL